MKSLITEMIVKAVNPQPKATNRKENGTMSTQIRIVMLSLLAILSLAAAVVPASAQCTGLQLYDSNPAPWHTGAWYLGTDAVQIGDAPPWKTVAPDKGVAYGTTVSFTLTSAATVKCFEFLPWVYPGDFVSTVYWSLDSSPFGMGAAFKGFSANTAYAHGTAHTGAQLAQQTFCPTNEYGYEQCVVTISLPPGGVTLSPGTYYLTLTLGRMKMGTPVFWDQYSASGAGWSRPPLLAAGTETFAIYQ